MGEWVHSGGQLGGVTRNFDARMFHQVNSQISDSFQSSPMLKGVILKFSIYDPGLPVSGLFQSMV